MKYLKWFGYFVVFLLVLAVGAYFYAQSSLINLDDTARKKTPGGFVTLSDG